MEFGSLFLLKMEFYLFDRVLMKTAWIVFRLMIINGVGLILNKINLTNPGWCDI